MIIYKKILMITLKKISYKIILILHDKRIVITIKSFSSNPHL